MNRIKNVIKVLMLLTCFLGQAMTVEAANTLPPGMVIGDSEGVYATSEGEYYIDMDNILPGETYEKEITIRSLDLEEPFSLGLLVEEKEQTGTINWNEYITLTLNLDGEAIYQGPILGDGKTDWSKTPLSLGVAKYGTDKILKAHFKVDSTLTNEHYKENNVLMFQWSFVGTKDQQTPKPTPEPPKTMPTTPSEVPTTPSSDPTPRSSNNLPTASGKQYPRTGEDLRGALYKFLAGILLVLIVLFLWKKKREEERY